MTLPWTELPTLFGQCLWWLQEVMDHAANGLTTLGWSQKELNVLLVVIYLTSPQLWLFGVGKYKCKIYYICIFYIKLVVECCSYHIYGTCKVRFHLVRGECDVWQVDLAWPDQLLKFQKVCSTAIFAGFSADVCCWGNHSACWYSEDFSFENCCSDFIVGDLQAGLAALGGFDTASVDLFEWTHPIYPTAYSTRTFSSYNYCTYVFFTP